MAWPGRFFADDEELGKKNDDHRPLNGAISTTPWSTRKPAPAIRKRRILYAVCAALFVYLFVKNIPTDLGPHPRWADTRVYQGPREGNLATPSTGPPTRKPPRPSTPSKAEEHYHDGPIKFYKLASSLHSVAKLGGQKEVNKNVLFAAASLKSVSELIPLACEMGRRKRSDVHFAIMGRDDMEIGEILKLSGVSGEDCNVNWHDARPDYSKWSSDYRMEVSVAASLGHIQEFVHPQVILIDEPNREDDFLVAGIREKAMDLSKPLVELPSDAAENLMWITRLDSASLAAWPQIYIDILIQAPSQSSGSLVRLLKSIEDADYFGARRPHLTIELPAEVDPPTWRYLENLIWPPIDWSGTPHISQVSLRHRISRRTTTPEEASARLVESFYPVRTMSSHILLLSPQTELSSLYYHYLFYSLLEYKYSENAKANRDAASLMGISLDLPSSFLNDTTDSKPRQPDTVLLDQTSFLWQAPNSNAALYFGDKWMEFHSFLTARLSKPPSTSPKIISEKYPSWLEYMLELMRARGWSLVYPGLFANDVTLSTTHSELYHVPEENSKKIAPPDTSSSALSPDLPLEANPSVSARMPPPITEHSLLESSLISLLPNQDALPELGDMSLISYDGGPITFKESKGAATSFSENFRQSIGACGPSDSAEPYQWTKAADLFCHLDDIYDHHAAAGPMTMEHDYSTNYPKQQPIEIHDPDMISGADTDTMKEEVAYHLSRQAGEPAEHNVDVEDASKTKVGFPERGEGEVSNMNAASSDKDENAQAEFKAQMGRHSKQAAEDNEKTLSSPSEKEVPKQGNEFTKETAHKEATRGAFDKEKPKAPNEKEIEDSSGRSPGW